MEMSHKQNIRNFFSAITFAPHCIIRQQHGTEDYRRASNEDMDDCTTFRTWNEFSDTYEKYLLQNNSPIFVINNSEKICTFNKKNNKALPADLGYKSVTFGCAHKGTYTSKSKGDRPLQRTEKIGCPASVKITFDISKNVFEIKKFVSVHVGHPVDECTFQMYSIKRGVRGTAHIIPRIYTKEGKGTMSREDKLSEEVKKDLGNFVKYKTPTINIKKYMQEEHSIAMSSKDVNNYQRKVSQKSDTTSGDRFMKTLLMDLEADKGMTIETVISDGTVQLIYFQFSWMKQVFQNYPDHILIDGTYCLNNSRMPLYIILAVDGNNVSVPVAFGLLGNETKTLVEQFIQFFIKNNPKAHKVKSYMTDKDMTEISVLKRFFPKAKHELCLFHVLKAFNKLVHESNTPKELSTECRKLLEAMAYADNEEAYNSSFETFTKHFLRFDVVDKFVKRWHHQKESWAHYCRATTFNLGDTTNNRLESLNSKLKKYIEKYAPLDRFYESLKHYLKNVLDKLHVDAFKAATHCPNTFTDIPCDILLRVHSCTTYYAYKEIVSKMSQGLGEKFEISTKTQTPVEVFTVHAPGKKPTSTTYQTCDCSFYCMKRLPCQHIFTVRYATKKEFFSESLIIKRWSKGHYLNTANLYGKKDVGKSCSREYFYTGEENSRYLESKNISNSIFEILKSSPKSEFQSRVFFLKTVINEWKKVRSNFELLPTSESRVRDELTPIDDGLCPIVQSQDINCNTPVLNDHPISPRKCRKRRLGDIFENRQVLSPNPNPQDTFINQIDDNPCQIMVLHPAPALHEHLKSPIPKQQESCKVTFPVTSLKPNKKLTAIGLKRKAPKPSERSRQKYYKITDFFRPKVQTNKNNENVGQSQPCCRKEKDYDKLVLARDQLSLAEKNKLVLNSNAWLDSDLLFAASCLLKKQHSDVEGLEHTTLQLYAPPAFKACKSQFVQIVNTNNNHWLCISGELVGDNFTINIYDSLHQSRTVAEEVQSVASSLSRKHKTETITARVHSVDLQPNSFDCGVYAVAFAKLLCSGKDPVNAAFVVSEMRSHLLSCLENNLINEFPCTYRNVPVEPITVTFRRVHCFCRQPRTLDDTMMTCIVCFEQFHMACLKEKKLENRMIENSTCFRCEDSVIQIN